MSRLLKENDRDLRGKSVRFITTENEQLIVTFQEAIDKAKQAGLDLVAVAENSEPIVVRLMDFGKFRYELKRKQKDQKKKQKVQKIKEIKFHVNIDKHDFELKVKHILEFLEKGNKVRVSLYFRGREMAHRDMGMDLMTQVMEAVKGQSVVDSEPKMTGRMIGAQLSPAKVK